MAGSFQTPTFPRRPGGAQPAFWFQRGARPRFLRGEGGGKAVGRGGTFVEHERRRTLALGERLFVDAVVAPKLADGQLQLRKVHVAVNRLKHSGLRKGVGVLLRLETTAGGTALQSKKISTPWRHA